MTLDAKIPSGPLAAKWDKHKFDLKLVNPANKRKFEILVVGSGLAGASAALPSASHTHLRVLAQSGRALVRTDHATGYPPRFLRLRD